MVGMGGIETIRRAQAVRPGLPAILLTGYSGDSSALMQQGARFVLLKKPVSITQLIDTLALQIANRGPG
jgi:CheY-like chemotaxis protein